MSTWGTLTAEFDSVQWGADLDRWAREGMPTGSEYGPSVFVKSDDVVVVDGRLRDVSDMDSPAVLAWFVSRCEWSKSAYLTWDVDRGPRYRYVYKDGQVVKLRGILD